MTRAARRLTPLLLATLVGSLALASAEATSSRPATAGSDVGAAILPLAAGSGSDRFPSARLRPDRSLWSASLRAAIEQRTRHVTSPGDGARTPRREPGDARAESSATNEGGFLGLSGSGEIAPSDTTGAAGSTHVATAVNVSYGIWQRDTLTDPPALIPPLLSGTLRSLFPSLPGGMLVFDPKVVYDPDAGRFVLAFLGGSGRPFSAGPQRSKILIAVIPDATATDPSTWCLRQLNGDQIRGDGKQFADYPGLGFDRERVYITSNQFDFGRTEDFRYAQILAIGKTRLYSCAGKLSMTAFGGRQTRDPSGGPAFTIQPAVTASGSGLGFTGYLASFQEGTCGFLCGKKLTIWRVKKRGRELDLASDEVNVPAGRMAPLGTQRDGSLTCTPIEHCWDAGDLRLVTAFYDADRDRFYTAHAIRFDVVPGDGYLESSVRWYEVDPSPVKRSSVTRTGIVGQPGRDSGWPSVGTDALGNLFVNYSRAGAPVPGEYLSAAVATIPPGSVIPSSDIILIPGEALYVDEAGRPQRWGDYSAVSRDPIDHLDMWTINQYARGDGVPPSTNLWQQVVNRVSA